MYTLYAALNNQTVHQTYSGEAIASIACNLLRADGWTVWMTSPNGSVFEPISLNEFGWSRHEVRSNTNLGTR